MRIFISYQTKKSLNFSEKIEKRLKFEFPNAQIFRAASKTGGIASTEDWLDSVRTHLLVSDFFVIVVDEDWVADIKVDPSYVRLETEIALVRSAGSTLYFLPVGGGKKPKKDDLPVLLRCCVDKQWPNEKTFAKRLSDLVTTLRRKWADIFAPQRLPLLFIGSTFSVEGESNDFLDYFGHIAGEVARAFSNKDDGGGLTLDCITKLPRASAHFWGRLVK